MEDKSSVVLSWDSIAAAPPQSSIAVVLTKDTTVVASELDWTALVLDWTALVLDWTALVLDWTALVLDWTALVLDWTTLVLHWTALVLDWTALVLYQQDLADPFRDVAAVVVVPQPVVVSLGNNCSPAMQLAGCSA